MGRGEACAKCGAPWPDDDDGAEEPWCSPCRAEITGSVTLAEVGEVRACVADTAELARWLRGRADWLAEWAGRERRAAELIAQAELRGGPVEVESREFGAVVRGLDPRLARRIAEECFPFAEGPLLTREDDARLGPREEGLGG